MESRRAWKLHAYVVPTAREGLVEEEAIAATASRRSFRIMKYE